MWVVCVVAAVLFFVVQVSLRVGVFFEYNTNVDVEKVYTTKLPFPAVTICNQNKFRLVSSQLKRMCKKWVDSTCYKTRFIHSEMVSDTG